MAEMAARATGGVVLKAMVAPSRIVRFSTDGEDHLGGASGIFGGVGWSKGC